MPITYPPSFPDENVSPATIAYTVQVLWDDAPSAAIQFDITLFGQGGRFIDPFVVDWNDPAVETLSNVTEINIARGRDDNLEFYSMGECSIIISDNDGRYNPSNSLSPLYGNVRPMRRMRVYATVGQSGSTTELFEGYIRSIEHTRLDGNRGVTTLLCGDFFLYMGKTKPVFANVGRDTTTGEVLSTMISAMGVTDSSFSSIQTGDVIPSPGVGNSSTGQTALQIASALMEIERGDFFISRSGVVTFKNRNNRFTSPDKFIFVNASTRVATTSDLDRVKNKAAVVKQTDVGDFTADWTDGASVGDYGQQDFSTISSFYIYDATQAQALAQWLVSQRKDPLSSVRSLEIFPKTFINLWALAILELDIPDKVGVIQSGTGMPAGRYFIESIRHSITPDTHRMSLGLVKVDTFPLILAPDDYASQDPDLWPNSFLDTNTLAY